MNKIYILLLIFTIGLTTFSCKKEQKKVEEVIEVSTKEFTIDKASIKMNWVAFKTSEKTPVNGQFNKVELNKTSGASAIDFLNNLEFSVPVSSIFSNNEERDSKLQKFFFGVMDDTELLSGSISITNNTNGVIHLTMNGITHDLPIKYLTKDKVITIKGILNLENWNAQNAVESLNKACFDLHKGEDGISKTWNTVNIKISFSEVQ